LIGNKLIFDLIFCVVLFPMSKDKDYCDFANLLQTTPLLEQVVDGIRQNPSSLPQLLHMLKSSGDHGAQTASIIENDTERFIEFTNSNSISFPMVESPDNVASLWDEFENDGLESDILRIIFDTKSETDNDLSQYSSPSNDLLKPGKNINDTLQCSETNATEVQHVGSVLKTREKKKRKISAIETRNKLLEFPNVLMELLNSGDMDGMKELIDDWFIENSEFSTPKIGENHVTGREYIKGFFLGLISMHPDLIANITDIRLGQSRNVIYRGLFEGTYIPTATGDEKYTEVAATDESATDLVSLVISGRTGDRNFGPMSQAEKTRLEELSVKCRMQHCNLKAKSTFVGRLCQAPHRKGSRTDSTKNLVSRMTFDWKVFDIQEANL
jgi:hypothetical protein